MANNNKTEVWLRGPLQGMPPLVQPVAHALLQAREEVNELMDGFPEILLWVTPVGLASPGFHLQHLAGVVDRLFTYARGEELTEHQFQKLNHEGKEPQSGYSVLALVEVFNRQVNEALKQLTDTDEMTLADKRTVGRAKMPSTVLGLYTHAAEHTMRHVGQLLVTAKILRG